MNTFFSFSSFLASYIIGLQSASGRGLIWVKDLLVSPHLALIFPTAGGYFVFSELIFYEYFTLSNLAMVLWGLAFAAHKSHHIQWQRAFLPFNWEFSIFTFSACCVSLLSLLFAFWSLVHNLITIHPLKMLIFRFSSWSEG